ncbi:MAG TPA: efflux RND transporter permease subunit [Kofleriaceae bacterium]|nr:efflux RND transporter permease subunit [Kofleriaceae bacterium]
MNLSAPFIRRPIATTLLAIALFLAGAAAYTQLPVAPLPRVDYPTISVSAGLPGASPETMAAAVATPLERRLGRIAGVTEMTSTSSLGSANVTIQFDLDRDVESAARDVQAAINAAGGDLPPNLPTRPHFRKVNPADAPILILTLKSKSLPLAQVFETANTVLAQKIAQVPGVGQVNVGGGQQPAVRVQVDPMALAGAGLSMEDVRAAIASATADQPKGAVGGVSRLPVSTDDQLTRAADWSQVIVHWQGEGGIRLGEIARVTDDVENQRAAGWADGERTIVMIIRRQPGANILDVIDRVKTLLPELTKSISPAIEVEIAIDRAQSIRASVRDVERALITAIVLVVLIVFVFLRTARATAIPSIAVPLSLVGTFAVMYLCGFSIDNLSLMALTISTGFVVDDAIVVTENVTRLLESGMAPREAALRGAKQIGFTIVSITASLLAVFIPLLFMGGVVGRLFREFAITLAIAISMSALISLTLTPMMCARLLREAHGRSPTWIGRALDRGLAGAIRGYGRVLSFVLAHRRVVGVATLGLVGLTVWLYTQVPRGLFPEQDNGMLLGQAIGPQDISFPAMKARVEQLNAIIERDPDVDHFVSSVGGGLSSTLNAGTMFISLKPKPERKASAQEVIARLRPKLAKVTGINLYLQALQDVRVGGRLARTEYQYTLADADLLELEQWGPRVTAALKKLPELKDVSSDQQTDGLELEIVIDRDTAARLGVTAAAVDATLYDAYGQRQVATFYTQVNQYRVVLEADPALGTAPDTIARLYVPSTTGPPVPLSAIATTAEHKVPLSIGHQGQFPVTVLAFNTAPGVSLGDAVRAIAKAEQQIGMPASIHASFAGTAQAFQDSVASQPYLIAIALFAVYIVLGVLYESYIHPITILSTLPSAGLGALLALLVTGSQLDLVALVGIILLIGIVKKNAILMIDFAIEKEREEGLDPAAAIHAAALQRFRPIVMTTLAALLGALPLALGHGMGGELRRPLGIAIVGGLALSQLLTLFTTPVTYVLLDRFTRFGRKQRALSPGETRPAIARPP